MHYPPKQANTKAALLIVNTHHYGNLQFYTMHLSVQYNHFNRAHWVVVRCEASEATPTVAEVSEASGSYLYIISVIVTLIILY